MRTRRNIGLLALVALCLAVAGFSGANFAASSSNAANTFSAADDYVAPTVTLTTPADGSLTNDATPTLNGAAGTATGDSNTVTVRIYGGSSATGTPVQTLSTTRSGATWSVTPSTSLSDGTYTVRAEQSDGGANTGFSAPATFSVDATSPQVTLTSPANGALTNNTTPTYSGAAGTAPGDSSTVTVKIYSGATATGTPVQTRTATPSSGSWSVPGSPALADGVYTAQAEQDDTAGNPGTSAANTFTVKTVGPGVTLTSPADGSLTNNQKPSFGGAAGDGPADSATVTVKIYSGSSATGTPVQTLSTSESGGAWSVAPSINLADGTYTAQAEQSDILGNKGTSSAATFTVDATAPAGVTLTAPANNSATNNTTPTFSGAAGNATGDSSTVTVKLYSGSTVSGSPVQTLGATRSGTSWSTAASPALAEGTYTAQAEQSDSAGNKSTTTASTFTVDATAPAGLTLTAPANNGFTNSTTLTFSGAAGNATGDSSTVTVKVYSGSTVAGSPVQTRAATRSGTSWSVGASPALAQGTYTAQAEQTDSAGNTATSTASTFVIDTTAPTVPASIIAATSAGTPVGSPGWVHQGGKYRVYANASDASSGVATVSANVSNVTTGQTSVVMSFDSTGVTLAGTTYHYVSAEQTANASLATGTKSHTVTATDSAANSSGAVSFSTTGVDNTAPGAPSLTDPGANLSGTIALNSTATDSGGSGVAAVTAQYSAAGASSWHDVCADTTSPYSCSLDTTTLTDGLYDFQSISVDNAGNVSNASTVRAGRRIDNTPPTLTGFTMPASPLSGNVSPSASSTDTGGSGVANVKFQVAPTGTSTWSDMCTDTSSPYSCAWDSTGVSDGDYDFRAIATDTAGNATTSGTLTRHVDNGPSALSVAAANGTGTLNRPDAGDVMTFAFSEPIDPATVESGWNGSAKTVSFKITRNNGSNQTVTVTDGATTLNVGTVNVNANFISTNGATLTFASSTIQVSGSNLVVTLGGTATFGGGGAYMNAPGAANISWTAASGIKDLQGHTIIDTNGTETDGDADF